MAFFVPQSRLGIPHFDEWLSDAARTFWFSGFDRNAGYRNLEMVRDHLVNENSHAWGFEESGKLGIAVLAPCEWETSVIRRPVARVLFLAADSYNIALELAIKLRNHAITQHMAFVSADPGVSPAYVVCVLERVGFHLAAQYYHWVAKASDAADTASKLASRYAFRFATAADAAAVEDIARKGFTYGRYVADPRFKRGLGHQIYGAWAANSCRGYADVVIVYETNEEVCGFATGKVDPSGQTARVGLLAVKTSMRNSGIGVALLAKAVLWCAERGVDTIRVGTEKPNVEVSRIYRHFGFELEDSGLVLHWCSEEEVGIHESAANFGCHLQSYGSGQQTV